MFSLFKTLEAELPDAIKKQIKKNKIKRGVVKSLVNILTEYSKLDIANVLRFTNNQLISNALDDKYDSVNEVEQYFEKHVSALLNERNRKILTIFIDDLDRCNPDNVVIMLESIKNFFGTKNCIFVVAVDKKIVASGIQHKYGDSKFISGDDYLEKIINYSLDLKIEPQHGIQNLIDYYHQTYNDIIKSSKPEFLLTAFELTKSQNIRCAKKILDKYVLVMKDPVTSAYDSKMILFVIILQEMFSDFYSDVKKLSDTSFIDDVMKTSIPGAATDLEKINETQRLKYNYALRTPIKELIYKYKQYYFDSGKPEENNICVEIKWIINYLETHIVVRM